MLSRIRWWRRHATPPGDATPRHFASAGDATPRHDEIVAEYNTRDARDLFSHLLRRVRRGEVIVIAHAGRPVARLVPYGSDLPRRKGVIRAQIVAEDDRRLRSED
jgi:prevent-host-death family protein